MNIYEPMPIVECEKFYLRTVIKKDYKNMYEYGSDMDVIRYCNWGPFRNLRDAKIAIDNVFLSRFKKNMPIGYAIVWKENNKMIGTIDFHTIDFNNKEGEIGYVLNKDYWGMGIMSLALKKMINIGFEILNLNRIIIAHLSNNPASEKVIRNCDFRYEGTMRKKYYNIRKMRYEDGLLYSILKDEYLRGDLKWQSQK